MRSVTGVATDVHGAGRTDAGVHAEGQVAHARVETRLAAEPLRRALNGVLPRDVAVRALGVAPDAFHARRGARSKLYRYASGPARRARRCAGAPRSGCGRRSTSRPCAALAAALVGRHDFASFQAAGSVGSVHGPDAVALRGPRERGGDVRVELEGDGFLRHMVRNVVGTLLEVGLGGRPTRLAPARCSRPGTAAGRVPPRPPAGSPSCGWTTEISRRESKGLDRPRA